MELYTITTGLISNNTYILTDGEHGVIIDSAMKNPKLEEFIKDNSQISFDYIIATHGHFDHVRNMGKIKKLTGAKIAVHPLDKPYLEEELAKSKNPERADVELNDADIIKAGDIEIEVIHTPGHSHGGICLKCGDMLFTGDTLFKGTVGRTDFECGDYNELMKSIDRLSKLQGDYKVYPGHNEPTTLATERARNPYFNR